LPSLVKHPSLFFKLQSVSSLISQLSLSLWVSFDKVAHTVDMAESGNKIVKFVHAIEEYAKVMADRHELTVERNNSKPLSVNITIEKKPNARIAAEKELLIQGLRKDFRQGCVYGIIGKTGCGKSTFFNVLFDIYPFASGNITLPNKGNIVYVLQNPIFKIGQNWADTIFYPLGKTEQASLPQDLSNKVTDWIKALQIEEIATRAEADHFNWTNGLSGGEQQRVALLQAFIRIYVRRYHQPESNIILLLDESISKLDHELQDQAFALIKRVAAGNNITVLSIDHSSRDILHSRYGNNILNLNDYSPAKQPERNL
jgi:putative ATP-binding cassette transporter